MIVESPSCDSESDSAACQRLVTAYGPASATAITAVTRMMMAICRMIDTASLRLILTDSEPGARPRAAAGTECQADPGPWAAPSPSFCTGSVGLTRSPTIMLESCFCAGLGGPDSTPESV